MIFSKINNDDKVKLTDDKGKITYVKKDEVDNYVLTSKGWIDKNKSFKVDMGIIVDGKLKFKKVSMTGLQIYLSESDAEKERKKVLEENKHLFTPEGAAELERNCARLQNELLFKNLQDRRR